MRAFRIMLSALFWAGVARAADAPPPEDAYRGGDPVLLEQVRADFKAATESAAVTRRLIALLDGGLPKETSAWPPIFRAYRASLEGLVGKHSFRPWEKYTRVKAGIAGFAGLAEAHPGSIEIRALRFAFYSQLPDLFGVRPLAEQDLSALAGLFERGGDSTVSEAYCREVIRWILQNGNPAPGERRRLEAAQAAWP